MSRIDDLLKNNKLKRGTFSEDMCKKEFNVAKKDLESAKVSYETENYKWATIQAYYAIFHGVRSLIYKAGYREESHAALKAAFKEIYIDNNILSQDVYNTLERGMNLREIADYKENYSQNSASKLIEMVIKGLEEIEIELNKK